MTRLGAAEPIVALQNEQTYTGAHLRPSQTIPEAVYPEVPCHPLLSIVEIKNGWRYTATSPYAFIVLTKQ